MCSAHIQTTSLERSGCQVRKKREKEKKKSLKTSIWSGSAESFTKTEVEKREKRLLNTKSGFYVMPAASQSEPQDAYGEAEKTNTEGCPFCILDAFPSRKYQSSPGMLLNQFTQDRPVIFTL